MNYKEHMPKAPRALSERGLQSLQVKDETNCLTTLDEFFGCKTRVTQQMTKNNKRELKT